MKLTSNNLIFKSLPGTIIDGVSFSCDLKQKTAIYGPSGSGKKVLLLLLGGLLKPNSGSVYFDNVNIHKNLKQFRSQVSFGEISDINPLIEELSPHENILFCTKMRKCKKPDEYTEKTLEKFGIRIYADTPLNQISPLARAVTSLACAYSSEKKYLFIDEPTEDLTDLEAKKYWIILNQNLEDKILFFTTKNYNEAQMQSDHVIVLNRGRLK